MARRPLRLVVSLALASASLAAPAVVPTASAQECDPGTLYFSQDGNANGLFEVDVSTGEATLVGSGETGTSGSTIGLTETDDPTVLWGSTYTDFAIINADGSGATVLPTGFDAEALGYDTAADVLYGAINGEFFIVDPATGTRTGDVLDQPGDDVEGLAVDPDTGIVYGLPSGDPADLLAYDPVTDDWSTVGSTGLVVDSVGLAFDPVNDVLYAISEDGNLYTIDPATGDGALVGSLGLEDQEGGGAAFVPGNCPEPTTTSAAPTTTTTAAAPTSTAAAAAAGVTPRFTG